MKPDEFDCRQAQVIVADDLRIVGALSKCLKDDGYPSNVAV